MDIKRQTSKEYFKSLQIIYLALLIGQLSFGIFSFLINSIGEFNPGGSELRGIFIYLVPLFTFAGLLGSKYIFIYRLKATKAKNTLLEKMADYRSAIIVKYALLEAPFFFAIVVYLLTSDKLFLGWALLIIVVFLSIKPGRSKVVKELKLNPSEEASIHNPDMEIAEFNIEK